MGSIAVAAGLVWLGQVHGASGLATAAFAGGASGAIATRGDLQGTLISIGTSLAFYGVGSYFERAGHQFGSATADFTAKTLAHGLVGGISSSLQGGSFRAGFTSAAFAQAVAGDISSIQSENYSALAFAGRVVAASIAGGVGAELGGGKFKNGAITGAFSRLFNREQHNEEGESASLLSAAHDILGVAGMIPVAGLAFDLLDVALWTATGDFAEAGFSLAAAVPFGGDVLRGGRIAAKTADKFSRTPKSLMDEMVFDAAKQGKGQKIIDNLGDPQFKGMEKWSYGEKSAQGLRSEVHYVRDPKTGQLMDFKFKHHAETYK